VEDGAPGYPRRPGREPRSCTVAPVTGTVHVQREAHVGTIVLDHPERHNAISSDMWKGLFEAATELGDDDDIRVVVIRGAGEKAFAAGADISQFGEQRSDSTANRSYDDATAGAHAALSGMPKPLIALIHGYCIGGGLAVALTADIRVASDDARFTIPAARLGLGYGAAGIGKLVQLVGPSAAKRILFLADRFGAEEASAMGLVNRVVPKAELDDAVAGWVATIAENAPLTLKAVKATVAEWSKPESRRDFTDVDAMIRACFDSADYQEGVSAFMEKRTPRFTGR
jgi:enoyl-CoA hydratase